MAKDECPDCIECGESLGPSGAIVEGGSYMCSDCFNFNYPEKDKEE